MKAAGILFLTPKRRALFLRRSDQGDCAGSWAWPGGKTEEGETAEQCAVRECTEEIGLLPKGPRAYHTRSVQDIAVVPAPAMEAPVAGVAALPAPAAGVDPVDFTTFLQLVPEEFIPELNDEHDGWCWADVASPPQPLHPGAAVALGRLSWDELGVARAMAAGQLTSPQRYENVSLFDIRITGTGVAYRQGLDEFVWRDPAIYLNDEFLARANGLAVIMEHPRGATLNSQEYADRSIGTVLLPYIKGEEVWGIAKVYDDDAIAMMSDPDQPMSTSPTVVFKRADNKTMKLEDGSTLLIEGTPSLLDHIAVCPLGVWDKGGEPAGVIAVADAQAGVARILSRGLDPDKLNRLAQGMQLLSIRASNLGARRTA